MKILIDLDGETLKSVEKLAETEQRSRKKMIELIVERSFK